MSIEKYEKKKFSGAWTIIKEVALNSSVGWSFAWPAILANALRSIVDATIFIFIATVVYAGSKFTWNGLSYPEYVFAGLFASLMLNSSLTIPTGSLNFAYGMGELDVYQSLPYSVYPYVIGNLLYSYLVDSIYMISYLAIGEIVFGFSISPLTLLQALIVILLGSLATLGLGLLTSISYFKVHVKNPEPLNWAINLLVSILAGYYFPVSVLPLPLQYLSLIFPHTYVFEATRLIIYGKASIFDLQKNITPLILLTMILLPLGIYTYIKVIKYCEKNAIFLKWS